MAIRRAIAYNIETIYVVDKTTSSEGASLPIFINGLPDISIAISNLWKQVEEKLILVNGDWKPVVDMCVLLDGVWECETGPISILSTPFEMYGKEHKSSATYNPDISFLKSDSTTLKMISTSSSLGTGYIFASFKALAIDGLKLRVDWEADVNLTSMATSIYLRDGEYDRSSIEDFPSGSGLKSKGSGNLKTIAYITDSHVTTTIETIDTSLAQLDVVTIMIRIQDSWNGYSGDLYVSEFMFTDQNDNVIARVDKSGSFNEEVTGTYADYGTWGVTGG